MDSSKVAEGNRDLARARRFLVFHYETALGGKTLGTIAGHVGVDRSKVLAMLSEVPDNDGLALVFVRLGILGTGGKGIAVIGGMSAPTTIHEWGHAFAGLSDE